MEKITPEAVPGEEHVRRNTRDQIFAAATRVFARKGFVNASIDEIADAARVAKGTIYYHFTSKEELFLYLIERGGEELFRAAEAARQSEKSPLEQLRRMIRVTFDYFTQHQDLCMLIMSESWGANDRRQLLQTKLQRFRRLIEKVLLQGQQEGLLADGDPELIGAAVFGMSSVIALHYLAHGLPVPAEAEEQLFQLLHRGLQKV